MDSEYWKKVERIIDLALESDPSRWPSVLDEQCEGDAGLRGEAANLLSRYTAARSFLESPPAAAAAALVAEARDPAERFEGRRIGAYRIVRQIGRGGMSRVFLAERADGAFEQQVALKVLRPGLDSEIDLDRFRAERQILATLNHPNIARLLDGGVSDGIPYLALEYVDGQPIDAYCDAHALSVRQRLELFVSVADATEYAHRSLVVHRDLKPSNIFITGDGVVKLLDFGLAKLLEPGSDASAPSTRAGHRWMTPEYAAPEQIAGAPVTTLTDVYQLGAVLYELLTGAPPFGKRDAGVHELEQAVLRGDPALPSMVAPTSRRRALQGDLDAILLKALNREPDERYGSPRALVDDLRRHLSGHPVLARRQTVSYRARRFGRRHQSGLAAAAVVVLLLATYVVTVAADRRRIRRALGEATDGTHRAEQVTDFMLGLFDASSEGQSFKDTIDARALLARGLARARELSAQPALEAQMLDVVGRLETQLGAYDRARPPLEEALALRRKLYGDDHPDVATSLQSLAQVSYAQGDFAEAVKLRSEVLALRRRQLGDSDTKTTNSLLELASAMHSQGNFRGAQPLLDEWVAIVSRQPAETTDMRASQLASLADVYDITGKRSLSLRLSRQSLAIYRALYGEHHPRYANALVLLGSILDRQAPSTEAERVIHEGVDVLRAAYPAGHPDLAYSLRLWGITLEHLRRFQDAQAPLREALAMNSRFAEKDNPHIAEGELDLSVALSMTGGYDEAVTLARHAVRRLRTKYPETNLLVMRGEISLGDALRGMGKYAEAEPLLLAGYKAFESGRGFTVRSREYALGALVRLYSAEGRPEEAAKYEALKRPVP